MEQMGQLPEVVVVVVLTTLGLLETGQMEL
jgi:hypothetical protein